MEPQDLEMPDFNDYTPEVRALIVLLGQTITYTARIKLYSLVLRAKGAFNFQEKETRKEFHSIGN